MLIGIVPHLLGADLDAAHRVEYDNSAIGHAETTDHFSHKVHISGCVHHVKLMALPFAGNQRRIDRHPAPALFVVPVRDRRAVVYAAQTVDSAGIEQHGFGQ